VLLVVILVVILDTGRRRSRRSSGAFMVEVDSAHQLLAVKIRGHCP
jgi:hypothetical protein